MYICLCVLFVGVVVVDIDRCRVSFVEIVVVEYLLGSDR